MTHDIDEPKTGSGSAGAVAIPPEQAPEASGTEGREAPPRRRGAGRA